MSFTCPEENMVCEKSFKFISVSIYFRKNVKISYFFELFYFIFIFYFFFKNCKVFFGCEDLCKFEECPFRIQELPVDCLILNCTSFPTTTPATTTPSAMTEEIETWFGILGWAIVLMILFAGKCIKNKKIWTHKFIQIYSSAYLKPTITPKKVTTKAKKTTNYLYILTNYFPFNSCQL